MVVGQAFVGEDVVLDLADLEDLLAGLKVDLLAVGGRGISQLSLSLLVAASERGRPRHREEVDIGLVRERERVRQVEQRRREFRVPRSNHVAIKQVQSAYMAHSDAHRRVIGRVRRVRGDS